MIKKSKSLTASIMSLRKSGIVKICATSSQSLSNHYEKVCKHLQFLNKPNAKSIAANVRASYFISNLYFNLASLSSGSFSMYNFRYSIACFF